MRKAFFFLAILLIIAIPAMAQDTIIDPDVVNTILDTGVAGTLGAIAATELLKRLLKTQGALSVALSIIVSIVITGAVLLLSGTWALLAWALYSAVVAAACNGIYLFPRRRGEGG